MRHSARQLAFRRHAHSLPLRCALLPLCLVALTGCQTIDVGYSNAAQIRLIAAAPEAPGLDFAVGVAVSAYNVSFGDATSYVQQTPGSVSVSILTHNATQVAAAQKQVLAPNRTYTALVSGAPSSLTETILQDQNAPAPSGQISVRVLDGAMHAGAVDVYLVPSTGKLTTSAPLLTGVAFGSNSGYVNVPFGTYALAVVPAGTLPVPTTATLFTGPSVSYDAGSVRTIVLIDLPATTQPASARPGSTPSGVSAIIASDYDPAS